MKTVLVAAGGALLGAGAVLAWLAWYLRDAFR